MSTAQLLASLERALRAAQAENLPETAKALIEAVEHVAEAEKLHVEMLALRDDAAQAVAMLDTFNSENSLEHTHNPATPLDPAADARIIQALRDGHGTRWGIRLVELQELPGVLAVEPADSTEAGEALFFHAREMGKITRGEVDPDECGALH